MSIKHNRNFDHYGLANFKRPLSNLSARPHAVALPPHAVALPRSSTASEPRNRKKGIQLSGSFLKSFQRLYGRQIWQPPKTNEDWCDQFRSKSARIRQQRRFEPEQPCLCDITNRQRLPSIRSPKVRITYNDCSKQPTQVQKDPSQLGSSLGKMNYEPSSSLFSNNARLSNESWSTETTERKLRGLLPFEEYFRGSLIDELRDSGPLPRY